ncbi:MAG: hypothetical protein QM762_28070 [Chryseolinea sp.]
MAMNIVNDKADATLIPQLRKKGDKLCISEMMIEQRADNNIVTE